jgi:ABC-2 type transport system ATP-binding protein
MSTVILENVSKTIKNATVLKGISLTLEGGKIYGLIGRNGSGKTMLLRMLAGLITPTGGQIRYEDAEGRGGPIGESGFRVGITIESAQFYHEFTGYRNLLFLAQINGLIGGGEIREALLDVGLDPDDDRVVRKYSMGMKQRLAITQAIMENPDMLLLDEPTNALDEGGVRLIQGLIKRQAGEGAIVVIASHSKEDTEILCDELFVMDQGCVSPADGKPGEPLPEVPAHSEGSVK